MSTELKPITEEFIEQFLLEAQHRSGLPLINPISAYYAQALLAVRAPDPMLDTIMTSLLTTI